MMKGIAQIRFSYYRALVALFCYFSLAQISWCAVASLEEAPISTHYWRQTYYDSKEGSTHTTYKTRKTILNAEGIPSVSRLGFTYSQKDKVRIMSVIVTQPDGKHIKLKRKDIDTRLVASSSNGFTQDKQFSFLFPELKVGSTVELVFEHFHSGKYDPGLSGIRLAYFPLNERVETLYEEYISDQPWILKHINTENYDIKLSKDRKQVTVQQKAPYYYHLIDELNNSYIRRFPIIAMHNVEDWQLCVDREAHGWNKALRKPLPKAMQEAVRQVAGQDPEERVIGLMRYIRDNYRYLGDWRSVRRGWLPFSLAEIAHRGYGDCKDLSMALVAMLRASEIEAEPVVVTRGVCESQILLPSAALYNHAIVRAKIGEKIWWLDPTNSVFLPDYIMPDIHDRWALVFGKDNQVGLTRIPRERSDLPEAQEEAIQTYDQEGNLQNDATITLNRSQAIGCAARDYSQGVTSLNRQLCLGDMENCQIQRKPTEFLISQPYRIQASRYTKAAAKVIKPGALLVSYKHLCDLSGLRYYIDNKGQGDLLLTNSPTCHTRIVLKNCRLTQPVKSYRIQSPWMEAQLSWHNSEQGCVLETKLVRQVDWLAHKTIMSKEFKAFLEACEAISKDLEQVVDVLDTEQVTKHE